MTRRRPRRAKKVSLSPNLTIDSVQTIPRTPPTHVRRRSRQSDMVNSTALSQKHQQKKRDSKQTPSFLKTAREKIQLEPAMVTNMIITLPIRLVTIISPRDEEKDEEEYHEIVGFEVLLSTNSNEIIYAFRFASPMGYMRIQNSAIDVKCYKSVLIYSDDGKMMNMLYGLGTCSATCPNCLRKHNSRSVATWLREFRQFLPEDVVFEDFELRSGERNGYDACSSRANDMLGENKEYITGPSNTKPISRQPKVY